MPRTKKQATGDTTPESPATDKKQAAPANVHGWEPVPPAEKPKRGRLRKEAAVEDKPAPAPARQKKAKAEPPATEKKLKAEAKLPTTEVDEPAELVVFALRLTQAEREEIHAATGPGKASRFARTVILAAARRDMAGIKTAITENQRTAAA
jgi:hypothetical protein